VLVTGGVHVVNGKVALDLSFVDLEEEVLARDNFRVGVGSKDFLVDLLLEFNKLKLLFNNAVNAVFNFLDGLGIVGVDNLRFEGFTVLVLILQAGEVGSFFRSLLSSDFSLLGRVLPEGHGVDITSVSFAGVFGHIGRDLRGECSLENGSIDHATGNKFSQHI
jgi:hypothetical protein